MKREKHANELEISGGILYYARCFNSELARNDYEDVARILDYWAKKVGYLLWRRQWRTVSGKNVKELPFELEMAGCMLLTTAWVADIFSRKARDRRRPRMAEELALFENVATAVFEYTKNRVGSQKGDKAFRQYVHDLVKYKQIAELQRLGFLPKLSLPRRLWYRTFGIPDGMVFKRINKGG